MKISVRIICNVRNNEDVWPFRLKSRFFDRYAIVFVINDGILDDPISKIEW
jgi:hypothetical protein